MLRIIIGILVVIWLLGLLLRMFGFIAGLISNVFWILLIIGLILFVIDWMTSGRNKV